MIILFKFLVLAVATLAAEAFETDETYRRPGTIRKRRLPRRRIHSLEDWGRAERQAAIEGATP